MTNILRRKRDITDLLEITCCAFLPICVFFIVIPTALFIKNIEELKYDYASVAILHLFSALVLILLFAVFYLLPSLMRSRIARALFWIGIFMLVSDTLCPLKSTFIEGYQIFKEPLKQGLTQILIAEFILCCAIFIPRARLHAPGAIFTIALIIAQIVSLVGVALNSKEPVYEDIMKPKQRNNQSIDTVYHIIFDAFNSDIFNSFLKNPEFAEKLRGFIFFKNTFSNYMTTQLSVSSFLSGSLYSSNETLSEWSDRANKSGIFKTVINDGWRLWLYLPEVTYPWRYNHTAHVTSIPKLLNNGMAKLKTFRLIKFSFVRIAPVCWRQEAAGIADNVLGNLFAILNPDVVRARRLAVFNNRYNEIDYLTQVPMCKFFIEKERLQVKRGRYVFAHFIYPHPPYVWDAEGNFVSQSNVLDQSRGAAKLMFDFINMLKETGKFDSSLIIIHADHGEDFWASTFSADYPIPEHFMQSLNLDYGAEGLYGYVRPLLLIKPPFADYKQLQYNETPVQLKDLPATVYDLLKIDQTTNDAQSILRVPADDDREINIFITNEARSRPQVPDSLSHLSISRSRGWQHYSTIKVLHKKNKKRWPRYHAPYKGG